MQLLRGACALMSLFCRGGGRPGRHEIMLSHFFALCSDFSRRAGGGESRRGNAARKLSVCPEIWLPP